MRTDYAETNDNKLVRILRRYGLAYLLKRVLYRTVHQHAIRLLGPKAFAFRGKSYPYFRNGYNTTFINERAVEVPVFMEWLRQCKGPVLEIGNVLGHYEPIKWDVVDKFELFPGVQNVDVTDFHPPRKYGLIVAISTFEHIGFDEHPQDPAKLEQVIRHLWDNCLEEKGTIAFSVPLGWNPDLDRKLVEGGFPGFKVQYMQRTSWLNEWTECPVPQGYAAIKYDMFPRGLFIASAEK